MELQAPDLHEEAWEEWAKLCDELVKKCEEEMPDRAAEFAESVSEKLGDIASTIRQRERITPGQCSAITNMEAAIAKWLR